MILSLLRFSAPLEVIELEGEEQMLDYMGRHVQIEAVFTRGLKVLKKERKDTNHLSLSRQAARADPTSPVAQSVHRVKWESAAK